MTPGEGVSPPRLHPAKKHVPGLRLQEPHLAELVLEVGVLGLHVIRVGVQAVLRGARGSWAPGWGWTEQM